MEEQKLNKRIKWIFSSLFARNMPHVIIGCHKVPDTTFIASNIPLEEMEIYDAECFPYDTIYELKKEYLQTE